ncbi:MAG: NIPSNAP family protein [Burkholderiales bacterium]|nr:NIPSNAP family protein [Burkholderiales bacterium]
MKAMLLERRAYTFRPGTLDAFWRAQHERGIDPADRPIMARLVSYFEAASGARDQIVHLWRYDSYQDWFERLFFKSPKSEPYYRAVRPLMLAQENRFMAPAPVAGLTPLWGEARDWITGEAPIAERASHPRLLVEEETLVLQPGALPRSWEACRSRLETSGPPERLIGCFYTLVGQQHQVTQYRWHTDADAREASCRKEREAGAGASFVEAIRPLVMSEQVTLLRPAPAAALTPLFHRVARA